MSAVGNEVEDEAELAQFFGKALHLFVGHARGVPVERWRQVVGQHLVGELGMNRFGEFLRFVRDPRSRFPSTEYPRMARRPETSRWRTRDRPAPGNSLRESSRVRNPRQHRLPWPRPSRARRTTMLARRSASHCSGVISNDSPWLVPKAIASATACRYVLSSASLCHASRTSVQLCRACHRRRLRALLEGLCALFDFRRADPCSRATKSRTRTRASDMANIRWPRTSSTPDFEERAMDGEEHRLVAGHMRDWSRPG